MMEAMRRADTACQLNSAEGAAETEPVTLALQVKRS